MKKNNLFFLSGIVLIFLIMMFGYIYNWSVNGLKYFSLVENRNFSHFEGVKIRNFFNEELQVDLENSLSDQFAYSEEIRLKYYDNLLFLDYKNIPSKICKNKYVKVDSLIASFNCDDLFLYKYDDNYYNDIVSKVENNLLLYNKINKMVDSYYYYIPAAQGYDFEINENKVNIKYYLDKYFDSSYTYDEFDISGYEDYSKYFYKTDHHWNQDGSYKAYRDIVSIMTDDEPKEVSISKVFPDTNFYGTFARLVKYFDIKEPFAINYVDVGEYSLKINGNDEEMYRENSYIYESYSTYEFFNHYVYLNGVDEKIKVYDFNDSSKENVLIISNSYGNAVNHLIASHFNKTHVMDYRYFDEMVNISKYIEENNITKFLVIMDYWLFETPIKYLEVE